jgi:hypothetical protein
MMISDSVFKKRRNESRLKPGEEYLDSLNHNRFTSGMSLNMVQPSLVRLSDSLNICRVERLPKVIVRRTSIRLNDYLRRLLYAADSL